MSTFDLNSIMSHISGIFKCLISIQWLSEQSSTTHSAHNGSESFPGNWLTALLHKLLTLYGYTKTAAQQNIILQYGGWYTGRWWVGCSIWYSEEGPGRAGPCPVLSSLYQMQQPTHQQPVYKLHIIWYGTIITSGFWMVITKPNTLKQTLHHKNWP